MGTKDNKKKDQDKGKDNLEGTFREDSNTRAQDVDNEQNPHADDLSTREKKNNKETSNISDQYHSATKTGDIQKKTSETKTKAAQQGDDYYDQGAHQPSLGDEGKEIDEEKKEK